MSVLHSRESGPGLVQIWPDSPAIQDGRHIDCSLEMLLHCTYLQKCTKHSQAKPEGSWFWTSSGPDVALMWPWCGLELALMWPWCGPNVALMWPRCSKEPGSASLWWSSGFSSILADWVHGVTMPRSICVVHFLSRYTSPLFKITGGLWLPTRLGEQREEWCLWNTAASYSFIHRHPFKYVGGTFTRAATVIAGIILKKNH